MRTPPNPLVRSTARRTLAAGPVSAAIAAGSLLSAGTAAADPLVVDNALAIETAQAGQEIAIAPSTVDFKVRQAVLLAMPLAFDEADRAVERFLALGPIPLGTAEPGKTFYSGREIAEAVQPALSRIGLPEDKVDSVARHFKNLVSLGNALTLRISEPEEEGPAEPAPPEQPPPARETQERTQEPAPPPAPAEPADPSTATPPPGQPGTTPAVSVLPPTHGSLPGWLQSRPGQAPTYQPDTGELAEKARERELAAQQQAAGRAEALPAQHSDRVALPVLIAAVSLAVVTAGLVRSWVLRRQ